MNGQAYPQLPVESVKRSWRTTYPFVSFIPFPSSCTKSYFFLDLHVLNEGRSARKQFQVLAIENEGMRISLSRHRDIVPFLWVLRFVSPKRSRARAAIHSLEQICSLVSGAKRERTDRRSMAVLDAHQEYDDQFPSVYLEDPILLSSIGWSWTPLWAPWLHYIWRLCVVWFAKALCRAFPTLMWSFKTRGKIF